MAHQTEAACLLRTGTQYTRRLGLRPTEGGDHVFAGFKPGAFSLYFGDAPIFHFDLEGRWQRAFIEGVHYLKSLDTGVVAIERVREGANLVLHRRELGFAATADLDALVRTKALDVLEGYAAKGFAAEEPPLPAMPVSSEDLCSFLERIACWDSAAWFAQRERVLAVYARTGFLPPEAQHAVHLQATLGDSTGSTFGLSPAAEHAVRTDSEFEAHALEVAVVLGKRVLQCRSIFIGGGDFLHLPLEHIVQLLDVAGRVFSINPLRASRMGDRDEQARQLSGILTFLDRFDGQLPDRAGWEKLRSRHLGRVAIGIESGAPEVRAVFGKTWENDRFRSTLADLKAAEINLSVLLLVGAGGCKLAKPHADSSIELLNDLPLGPGDLVYLIDAAEVCGPNLARAFERRGLTHLPAPELLNERAGLLRRLAPLRTQRGAKVAPYSVEKQWG
jgi:hypothetical protein